MESYKKKARIKAEHYGSKKDRTAVGIVFDPDGKIQTLHA
jgi:hypothetical protein